MKPESIAFLNANRRHYEGFIRAGIVNHFDAATRQGMLDVIRAEFDPGYLTSMWCNQCVIDMLKFAYIQYDKWLALNGERIESMTFPKQE